MFPALMPRLVLPRGSPLFDGPRGAAPHSRVRPGIARRLCDCPVSSSPYVLCLGGVSVCCHCAILGLVISLLHGHCALRVVRLVTLHLPRLVLLYPGLSAILPLRFDAFGRPLIVFRSVLGCIKSPSRGPFPGVIGKASMLAPSPAPGSVLRTHSRVSYSCPLQHLTRHFGISNPANLDGD
jgi:hypothetical protein